MYEPSTVNATKHVEDSILHRCARVTGSPVFSAFTLVDGLGMHRNCSLSGEELKLVTSSTTSQFCQCRIICQDITNPRGVTIMDVTYSVALGCEKTFCIGERIKG